MIRLSIIMLGCWILSGASTIWPLIAVPSMCTCCVGEIIFGSLRVFAYVSIFDRVLILMYFFRTCQYFCVYLIYMRLQLCRLTCNIVVSFHCTGMFVVLARLHALTDMGWLYIGHNAARTYASSLYFSQASFQW